MTEYFDLYPPAQNATYVMASSKYDNTTWQYFATDPGKSLTGSYVNNQWYSSTVAAQRFGVDFGLPCRIKRLYIENAHHSGGFTNYGVKLVKLYGTNSSTAFAETSTSNLTDLTLLAEIEVAQHIASDVADPQYFSFLNTTDYRYGIIIASTNWGNSSGMAIRRIVWQSEITNLISFLSQEYSIAGMVNSDLSQLFGLKLGSELEQGYQIVPTYQSVLEQVYGLKLGSTLEQIYFDAPIVRSHLIQVYRDASQLKSILVQRWGEAARLTSYLDQEYSLPEPLRMILEQRYALTGTELKSFLDEQYNLSEYNLITSRLDQPYIIAPTGSLYYNPTILIKVGGNIVKTPNIVIEGSRDGYVMNCEFSLYDQADYLKINLLDEIEITIDTWIANFLVNPKPSRNRNIGNSSYNVKGESKAILLDEPFADPIQREFGPGMASVMMIALVAEYGVTLVWEIIDWFIPIGILYANSETPLSVIRKVVGAVGAILQSDPDGTLRAVNYYPYPVPEWETGVIDMTFSDQDNMFTLEENSEVRPGYNKYFIGDQLTSTKQTIYETVDIKDGVKYLYAYEIPWNGIVRPLQHSGGSWVLVEPLGIFEETILSEECEIVNGVGRLKKPIYQRISSDYKQTVLGSLTFGEDGTIKTEVFGQTLVEVTYKTKYWKFKITDNQKENVQFYMEEPE